MGQNDQIENIHPIPIQYFESSKFYLKNKYREIVPIFVLLRIFQPFFVNKNPKYELFLIRR